MPIKFKHSSVLPSNPLLMCVVGASGCGKSALTFKMLTTPDFLDYNNLMVFTTTPNQPYYKFLEGLKYLTKLDVQILYDLYENDEEVQEIPISDLLEEKIKQVNPNRNPTDITGITITNNPQILNVDNIDPKKKNLIIFDDCVTQRSQQLQQDFFTKGRHNSCHSIYQSQSFYGLDRTFIRKNANCFIFFSLNDRNLSQIIQDVNIGMDKNEFSKMCKQQWDNPDEFKYIFVNIRKPANERVKKNIFAA